MNVSSRRVWCRNGTVIQWHLQTGKQHPISVKHSGPVVEMALSPDGSRLLVGGQDGSVSLWDADTGKRLEETDEVYDLTLGLLHRQRTIGSGRTLRVSFTPEGARALTLRDAATLEVWDAEATKKLKETGA